MQVNNFATMASTLFKNHKNLGDLLSIKSNESLLIVNTLHNLKIIMKYVQGRTPVRNVLKTLNNKVKYSWISNGVRVDDVQKCTLLYNKTPIRDLNKDLSEYGIKEKIESIHLLAPNNVEEKGYTKIYSVVEANSRKLEEGIITLKVASLTGKLSTVICPK